MRFLRLKLRNHYPKAAELSPAEAIEEVVLFCSTGAVDAEPVVGEPPVDVDSVMHNDSP